MIRTTLIQPVAPTATAGPTDKLMTGFGAVLEAISEALPVPGDLTSSTGMPEEQNATALDVVDPALAPVLAETALVMENEDMLPEPLDAPVLPMAADLPAIAPESVPVSESLLPTPGVIPDVQPRTTVAMPAPVEREAAAERSAEEVPLLGSPAPALAPAPADTEPPAVIVPEPAAAAPDIQQLPSDTVASSRTAAKLSTAPAEQTSSITVDDAATPALAQAEQQGPLKSTAPAQPGTPATAPVVATAPAAEVQPAETKQAEPIMKSDPATPKMIHEQLRGTVVRMVSDAEGNKLIKVRLHPEELGLVTVKATFENTGVRIELIPANDAARDTIKSALQELRRDLLAHNSNATLDMGEQGSGHSSREERSPQQFQPSARAEEPARITEPVETETDQMTWSV